MQIHSPALTSIPLTQTVLLYSCVFIAALIVSTFLVTRVFYVRRMARLRTEKGALEAALRDLQEHLKRTQVQQTIVQPEPVRQGRGQQIAAVLVAVGGLSGLVATSTPIVNEILQGKFAQCESDLRSARNSGEALHRLLGFDESGWLGARQVVVKPIPLKRQSVALGNNTIRNDNCDSLKLDYDGTSPGIIESAKTLAMTITLGDKSSGVRLFVRPIRDPDKKR